MEHEHLISGLIRKLSNFAGEIAVIHDEFRAVQTDMAHVEATLRMFQPDIDMTAARVSRKPGRQAAAHGEMSRVVREAMRGAADYLTLRQIQQAAMTLRGMDLEGAQVSAVMRKRTAGTLRNLKQRRQAEDRHGAIAAQIQRDVN